MSSSRTINGQVQYMIYTITTRDRTSYSIAVDTRSSISHTILQPCVRFTCYDGLSLSSSLILYWEGDIHWSIISTSIHNIQSHCMSISTACYWCSNIIPRHTQYVSNGIGIIILVVIQDLSQSTCGVRLITMLQHRNSIDER